MELIWLAGGLLAGAGAAYLAFHRRRPGAESYAHLRDTVKAAAVEAFHANSEQFVQLARSELERTTTLASTDLEKRERAIADLVRPIMDGLTAHQHQLARVESDRVRTFGELSQHLRILGQANQMLLRETKALTESLKSSSVRGRWGEIALRNVVELAGMTPRCDFFEQQSLEGEDGLLRPDMIVTLPGGRSIAVDAKVPLSAYLEAASTSDDSLRSDLLSQHAAAVRNHARALGRKEYWSQFERSPEFVVMFLPGEAFFAAALQSDATLLESVTAERVIIASPTSLITLLKAAAFGWQQEAIAEGAAEVQRIGRELYDRLARFTEHLDQVGKGLERATKAYNSAVGTLDTRLLVSARRMKELAAWPVDEIEPIEQIDVTPRAPEAQDVDLPDNGPALT